MFLAIPCLLLQQHTGQNWRAGHFRPWAFSLVIHPENPYCPTSRANVRYFFIAEKEGIEPVWWFGGGYDLKFALLCAFEEDCIARIKQQNNAVSLFGDSVYADYKKWCDEYFYLPHRKETRGWRSVF